MEVALALALPFSLMQRLKLVSPTPGVVEVVLERPEALILAPTLLALTAPVS